MQDSGKTSAGNVRDVKIERMGKVTIYQRGRSLYLYYRVNSTSIRKRVAADLDGARDAAGKIAATLPSSSLRQVTCAP
jgi:hypothetical protein